MWNSARPKTRAKLRIRSTKTQELVRPSVGEHMTLSVKDPLQCFLENRMPIFTRFSTTASSRSRFEVCSRRKVRQRLGRGNEAEYRGKECFDGSTANANVPCMFTQWRKMLDCFRSVRNEQEFAAAYDLTFCSFSRTHWRSKVVSRTRLVLAARFTASAS